MEVPPIKAVVKIYEDVEKVWKTLFNEKGWDPWFTSGMVLEPWEGGSIRFRWEIEDEVVEDRGLNIAIVPERLWEFYWNEYEDGFRSRTTIKLHKAHDGGTWVEIEDNVKVLKDEDLEIAFSCAVGWGEFITRLKLYIEKGLIV